MNEGRVYRSDLYKDGHIEGGIDREFRETMDAAIQDLKYSNVICEEELNEFSSFIALTPQGYKVAKLGYVKYKEAEEKREKRKERKDRYEYFKLKYWWLPLGISIISLSLSIWSLIQR